MINCPEAASFAGSPARRERRQCIIHVPRAIKKGGLPATPGALLPRKTRFWAEGTSAAALWRLNATHIAGIKLVFPNMRKTRGRLSRDAAAQSRHELEPYTVKVVFCQDENGQKFHFLDVYGATPKKLS